MVIENKSNQPLNQQTGTVPDVSGGMFDWFQPLSFILVKKEVVGFQNVETLTPVDFQGVMQFDSQELSVQKQGERGWRKITVHASTALSLQVDEIIQYAYVRYRVMNVKDFTDYGYFVYSLIEDWEDSPSSISYPLVHTIMQYGLTMRGVLAA